MTPTILLTDGPIVFEGPLGALAPHSHAVVALLVGKEQPFAVKCGERTQHTWAALIPAGIMHELDFAGRPAVVVYLEPHQDDFADWYSSARGQVLCSAKESFEPHFGMTQWNNAQDIRPLLAAYRREFSIASAKLEPRLHQLAQAFQRGDWLDTPAAQLGSELGISASRLVHQISSGLGTNLRRLKQHYRFRLAARAISQGNDLTSAAHLAGFADSAHFSRAFVQTFGLSPSAVRLRSASWLG